MHRHGSKSPQNKPATDGRDTGTGRILRDARTENHPPREDQPPKNAHPRNTHISSHSSHHAPRGLGLQHLYINRYRSDLVCFDLCPVVPQAIKSYVHQAGLLTCSCFTPSRPISKVSGTCETHPLREEVKNSQQRVLLQTFTAFPLAPFGANLMQDKDR